MGKKGKKEPINLFQSHSLLHHNDPPPDVTPEDVCPGELRDTSLIFTPSQSLCECGITLNFRCTTKLVPGDTITVRLTGFKVVQATVFALEPRTSSDNVAYNMAFMAFYTGSTSPKGVPAQCIILKCRALIAANQFVSLGIPQAVHIILPEKLALNSSKLKIEGVVKHAEGGKIPRAPIAECTEVKKKRESHDEMVELLGIIEECRDAKVVKQQDLDAVRDTLEPEVFYISETSVNRRALCVGLEWRYEYALCQQYKGECQKTAQWLREKYHKESKVPMAVHKELARNFGLKFGQIIALEDCLATLHGGFYPDLSRAALMVMRLYTMETHDLSHLLNLPSPPCMHREIEAALCGHDTEFLDKWINTIAVLTTTTSSISSSERSNIPVLYAGIRGVSSSDLLWINALQPDDWLVMPSFLTCVPSVDLSEDAPSPPANAILIEINNPVEAVELGDCSQYPGDAAWLLPLMSSYSVKSVETLSDKGGLTRLVLNARGSLASSKKDDLFPLEERNETRTYLHKYARAAMDATTPRTAGIARCLYASLRLVKVKQQLPENLTRAKYIKEFCDAHDFSEAQILIEKGAIKWLVCTAEAIIDNGVITKPAVWIALDKKIATIVESSFLKRTAVLKQFVTENNVEVDFRMNTVNYGKGKMPIKRVLGQTTVYPFDPM